MANTNKRKGDRAEREAVAAVCRLAPDLVVARPQRLLGAGRREDTGDLWVLPGVTVQVKHRADPAHAIRLAADAAAVQAARAGCGFAVGLVPIPRARAGTVRWVACGAAWPGQPHPEGVAVFGSVTLALQQVRSDDDDDARQRAHRVVVVRRAPTTDLFLGTLEAWLTGYRGAVTGRPAAPTRTGRADRCHIVPHTVTTAAPTREEPHESPEAFRGVPVSREFVHLHVHTEHSTRDGLSSPSRICAEAAADGARAVAVTDHGTLAGAWRFDGAARAAGVKPIIGEEVYWAIGSRLDHDSLLVPRELDDGADAAPTGSRTGVKTKTYEHLTLLARTPLGWSNLSRMATASADSFWSKPRMDFDLLEQHAAGLIVLSGCIGGPVAGRLLRGDVDGAREQLTRLRDIVGPENCFVELMDHGIPAETRIRSDLLELARYAGVRPVATNDCHYAGAQEQAAHDLWLCVGQQDTMVTDQDRWRFAGTGYHMRRAQEMYRLFSGAEQACDTTLLVADMIDDRVLPEPRQRLPRFDVPAGFADAPAYLRHLVAEGAARRYGNALPAEVRARLNLEFRTIRQLGFADYFLIVHDVVTAARGHGILVGPGRGSAAGSLVLFCLGVVAVDPLANGLLFERFLDPDRTDMPDVDLDFDSDGQAWVFSYLTDRWGADRVARLGTFGYARGRQAVKDAARVLLPPDRRTAVGGALASRIPAASTPLAELLHPDNPDGAPLRSKAGETPDHRRVLDAARQIDGKVRSEGVHACGVVIATEPLDAVAPLRRDRREGREDTWVTQWDGADITALGMLKLDVLAIKNLDMVKRAVRLISDRTGEHIDPENLPTDPGDPRVKATWELIKNGRTAGLFQLASPGMTELARQIGPENLNDLSVLVALFRPGPLGEKMHERFAQRRNGREPVDYGIFTDDPAEQEILADVLGETLGSIVYQEQMMRLGTVMAGFTPAQSSRLRKAVSKKNPAEMAAVGALFAAGCAVETRDGDGAVVSPVFTPATATRVWDAMKHAAAFAFNKSHSYAYGTLAYTTAYLKANWPVEYGAAVLGVATRDDKRQQAFDELADDGITVLPASVNDSDSVSAAVDGGAIRLGLAEVKGVGAAADAIVAERGLGGPFRSLADLTHRVRVRDGAGPAQPLPIDAVEALIEAGACDEFGARLGLLQVARAAQQHPGVPVPTSEWGALERAQRERARTGGVLTGHPLREMGSQLRQWRAPGAADGDGHDLGMLPTPLHRLPATGNTLTIGLVTEYAERRYSRGRMATLTLEGSRGRLRGVIWDQVLTELGHRGAVPTVGRVIGVHRSRCPPRLARPAIFLRW